MLTFNLTPEIQKLLLKKISDDGELDLIIERVGKNEFKPKAVHKGQTILEMESFTMYSGDQFQLKGIRVLLEHVNPYQSEST